MIRMARWHAGLGGALVSLAVVLPAADAATSIGAEELYARISERARADDQRHSELKANVDAYLKRNGLTLEQLSLEPVEGQTESLGETRLRINGILPWSVTVSNDTEVKGRANLEAYVRARHDVMGDLAASDPRRSIEAVIAPALVVEPTAFARQLVCGCRLIQIIVDWWGPDGWVMASGVGFSSQNAALANVDLDAELAKVVVTALDDYTGLEVADLRASVRSIRLQLDARSALELTREKTVLIVDPLADVVDHFAQRVAHVEVRNSPDVFVTHGEENLGLSFKVGHWPDVPQEGP